MPEMEPGPKCCGPSCERRGALLHLMAGPVEDKVREDADYTGASFCSWTCLRGWLMSEQNPGMGVPYMPGGAWDGGVEGGRD